MSAPLFFLAVDIASIVCAALLALRVLARGPRSPAAQLLALITFNTIWHIALSRYDYRGWIPEPYRFDLAGWSPLLNELRNLTPGLFMILCFVLFTGRTRFPRWLLALFVLQVLLELPAHSTWAWPDGAALAVRILPALMQQIFVGFALYWTLADWQTDLFEARRRFRIAFFVAIALNIIGGTLLLRVLIPQDSPANYETHLALALFNLALFVVGLLSSDLLNIVAPAGRQSRPAPALAGPAGTGSPDDEPVLVRLAKLLEADQVYRRPGLSLGQLAALAGVPEYRLRRVIHERMGFENFNAFLHSYRIREACNQLRDPAQARLPILTIALTVGYQSINTFNRGFRDVMGMTPSAYRALSEPECAELGHETAPNSQ